MADLKLSRLDLPADGTTPQLEIGSVAIDRPGLHRARGVYKRDRGWRGCRQARSARPRQLPLLAGAAVIPTAPTRRRGDATASFRSPNGRRLVSVSDATSYRQGRMTSATYRDFFVPKRRLSDHGRLRHRALLGRGIKRVPASMLEELGLAQAVWVLDVEKFGPFLVESDLAATACSSARTPR